MLRPSFVTILLPVFFSKSTQIKRKCHGKNKGDDIPEIHIVMSVK